MLTLSQFYDQLQEKAQEKTAEDQAVVAEISGAMDLGARLARQFFPSKEAQAQVASAGKKLLRKLVVPAAAAGGAGAAGYAAGETTGKEKGVREERIRQILEDLFGPMDSYAA